MKPATERSLSRDGHLARVDLADRVEHDLPALEEERVENLLLGIEVVVDEPVGHPRLVRDVGHPAVVEALAREHAHRGVEDHAPLVGGVLRCRGHYAVTLSGQRYAGSTRLARLGSCSRISSWRARSRSAAMKCSPVRGRAGEHLAPGIDDHRVAVAVPLGALAAALAGRDHEHLVLDRAGAQQHLPVRLAGDAREVGGHRDDARAAQREDPVQLRKAQVVADGQPDRDSVRGLGQHDLGGRLRAVGLAVLDAPDLHVEHVDLAIDRPDLPVGAHVDRRVRHALAALAALGHGAGDQVDLELARELARPGDRAAVERLGAGEVVRRAAADVEPLGKHDQLGAVGRGRTREPLGRGEVPIRLRRSL